MSVQNCVNEAMKGFEKNGLFQTTPGYENDEEMDDTVHEQLEE